jgi:hypothetical protein
MLVQGEAKQGLGRRARAGRGEPASPRGIRGGANRGPLNGRSQAQLGLSGQHPEALRPQIAQALKLPGPQQKTSHPPGGGRPVAAGTGAESGSLLHSNPARPGPAKILPQP